MLDSTGNHFEQKVVCFLCDRNKIKLHVYTPKYGHMGEKLNCGSCIEVDLFDSGAFCKQLIGGKFYELKQSNGRDRNNDQDLLFIFPEEYQLQRSGQIYHYGGYELPNFGEDAGCVVWICAKCAKHNSATLPAAISSKFIEKLDHRLGDLLCAFFKHSIVDITSHAKKRFKHLPLLLRLELSRKHAKLFKNITSLPQTQTIKIFSRKLKETSKIMPPAS